MKTKLSLLLLFLSTWTWSQVPVSTPEEYETQKTYWDNYVNIQKRLYDITIPAEERVMFLPNMLSLSSGNWGASWHGSVANAKLIAQKASRKVVVFVFDTGAGFSNSRLDKAWWKGMEKQYTNDGTTIDMQGHSTHVSGIVGAIDPDGMPIGVAAELVEMDLLKIIPYEVLNDQGSGQFSWVKKGISDANTISKQLIKEGWFVIYNFSLGAPIVGGPLDTELKAAQDIGVFVAAASGNNGHQRVEYPGSSAYTNAVGSLDQKDKTVDRSSFSAYGRQVEFAASGRRVLSTIPNDGLAEYSGTSMATPTIAGLAAVVAATNPKLTAKEVEAVLKEKVFDVPPSGQDIYTGFGSPMLDSLFTENPVDEPEEPEEPGEDPPTQKKRTITVSFNQPYQVMWKAAQGGKFKEMNVSLTANLETKLFSEDAIQLLYDKTDRFFKRRVFIITRDDFLDAAYWVRHFYELLLQQDELKVEVIKIDAEYEGLRGRPTAKSNRKDRLAKKSLINTLKYDAPGSLSLLKEYNIKQGKQNFSPTESIWPIYRPKGFDLVAVLDSSCWYSQEDWTYDVDGDWYDWNKLKGITNYFTPNNHTSALIAWRPDTIPYHFQIAPYTNYPKATWTVGDPVVVAANMPINCSADFSKRKVEYTIQDQETTHGFARRIWFGRETGTWMGGANNSEGPFGGPASKDMWLWVDFSFK